MAKTAKTATVPNPITGFDIERATAQSFKQLLADFTEWCKQQDEPAPLPLKDGWTTITPEQALTFLQRTALAKGNRRPSFQQIVYYALQMKAGEWFQNGQPIIQDTDGNGLDGQHRMWASVLTGLPFETYVVASVQPRENLFASIDNSKSRSAADALETAGINGTSRMLSAVVKIARHYDAGVMTANSKGHVPKPSPLDVLRYVINHPGIRDAVHLQVAEYQEANELFGQFVGPFVGWKIVEAFDEEVLDDFMTGVMQAEPSRTSTDPLVALRTKLEANKTAATPMKVHQVLAHVIKAFNAWKLGQPLRRVEFRVDETYPKLVTSTDVPEAEAA